MYWSQGSSEPRRRHVSTSWIQQVSQSVPQGKHSFISQQHVVASQLLCILVIYGSSLMSYKVHPILEIHYKLPIKDTWRGGSFLTLPLVSYLLQSTLQAITSAKASWPLDSTL